MIWSWVPRALLCPLETLLWFERRAGRGLQKVWRHTFEVCIAGWIVAWLATEVGRLDLMHSKARLLVPC
jgi:hypothetical protein